MEALSPEASVTDVEDVRTIGRKGTGRGREEVLARERRRTWTPEQKHAIVAESLGSELTPTEVARKYAISSGLLYSWRQQVLGGHVSVVTGRRRVLRGSSWRPRCRHRTAVNLCRRRFLHHRQVRMA